MRYLILLGIVAAFPVHAAVIRGRITDTQARGLSYSNVSVVGTTIGATTDDEGRFELSGLGEGPITLRVTQIGFMTVTKTLNLAANDTLDVVYSLAESAMDMGAVDIVTERQHSGVDAEQPMRTDIVSQTDLLRNSMTGSVISGLSGETGLATRPCAMCGSCGVGMQGLDPSYTEINVNGMPMLSGIGTLYGLDGLAAADVSRVELVRGSGSSEYGSGAIAGAVNLISARPDDRPQMDIDASANQYGQSSLNIGASGPAMGIPMRLSVTHGVEPERIDRNDDGVTDTPKYHRTNLTYGMFAPFIGGELAVGGRLYREHRFAGELEWSTADRGSAAVYGREISTRREEATVNYSRELGKWEMSADAAMVNHNQDSWYGTMRYDAFQRSILAKLTVERDWTPKHVSTAQLTNNYQDYSDNLILNRATDLKYSVPGVMLQHTWTPSQQWSLQAGSRLEDFAEDGLVVTPRAGVSFRPRQGMTWRLSAGTGFRRVSIFNLDAATEAGFEKIVLQDDLEPERSLGATISVNQQIVTGAVVGSVDVLFYHTKFLNKIIAERGLDRAEVTFRNAEDAYSQGVDLQTRWQHATGWGLKIGASRSELRYQTESKWRTAQMQYLYSADAAVSRKWNRAGVQAELMAAVYGPQVLPEGRNRNQSPTYALWDVRAEKTWGRLTSFFMVKNLFDWTQSDNPYQRDVESGRLIVDSALLYGQLLGRTFHAGFSYTIGR